jgi:hypothetical protein
LLQCTYVDFQPYLGDYPFEHSKQLFDEDSQPSSCSNFDGHETLVIPEQSKTHTTEQQYFHPWDFYRDLQMKEKHFSDSRKVSFSRHEVVPYLLSSFGKPCSFLPISHLLSVFRKQ